MLPLSPSWAAASSAGLLASEARGLGAARAGAARPSHDSRRHAPPMGSHSQAELLARPHGSRVGRGPARSSTRGARGRRRTHPPLGPAAAAPAWVRRPRHAGSGLSADRGRHRSHFLLGAFHVSASNYVRAAAVHLPSNHGPATCCHVPPRGRHVLPRAAKGPPRTRHGPPRTVILSGEVE
jgi:hypothetical protein